MDFATRLAASTSIINPVVPMASLLALSGARNLVAQRRRAAAAIRANDPTLATFTPLDPTNTALAGAP